MGRIPEMLNSPRGTNNVVKICGLREPAHAVAAVRAGADWIGFVFAPGRRQITPELARDCGMAARAVASQREILTVGVFVDEDEMTIQEIADFVALDAVQIHGEGALSSSMCSSRPVIRVVRPKFGATYTETWPNVEQAIDSEPRLIAMLFDGYSDGAHGGTGVRGDWDLAAALAVRARLALAGGLTSENVEEAIQRVRPWGVDVSSGVETNGRKDPGKIEAFVGAARRGFAALSTS